MTLNFTKYTPHSPNSKNNQIFVNFSLFPVISIINNSSILIMLCCTKTPTHPPEPIRLEDISWDDSQLSLSKYVSIVYFFHPDIIPWTEVVYIKVVPSENQLIIKNKYEVTKSYYQMGFDQLFQLNQELQSCVYLKQINTIKQTCLRLDTYKYAPIQSKLAKPPPTTSKDINNDETSEEEEKDEDPDYRISYKCIYIFINNWITLAWMHVRHIKQKSHQIVFKLISGRKFQMDGGVRFQQRFLDEICRYVKLRKVRLYSHFHKGSIKYRVYRL